MENFYFLFIILFLQTNSQQKINPIHLIENKYPFVLSSTDDYYYVITKGKSLKIQKESGNIIDLRDQNIFNSQDYVYITDNLNNNFLYYQHKYYNIIYAPFISFQQITNVNPKGSNAPSMIRVGGIAQNNNTFIVYGYTNDNNRQLLFSSIPQNNRDNIENLKLIDNLSCKFIEGDYYVCGMIINSNLQLNILKYHFDSDSSNKSFTLISDIDSDVFNSLTSLGMYDTDKKNIKLLCAKKLNSTILCKFFIIINDNKLEMIEKDFLLLITTNNFNENNCYLSQFNSEYLFCCALSNFIQCNRINNDSYDIIKEFKIPQDGDNSYLTIKSNIDYITLFYMNNYNNKNNIYEYYIYLPTCDNKNYIIFNSIYKNRTKTELDKIGNLINIKTNRYYFEIKNPPDEFGFFIINNSKINEKILIQDNDDIIYFIISNYNISSNFTQIINYIVSVEEEAYTKECQISLTFLTCYHSCHNCSLDINYSNDLNHNCIYCNDNYYLSPINKSNCYSIEEKELNWYLDSSTYEYGLCHNECRSCNGPNKFNCLSCFNGTYLENSICKLNCSEGYFPIISELNNSEYYFICNKCYKNCKTCSEEGDNQKMNCETCKENQIKYDNNCFDIVEYSIKSFNYPENNNINNITNCYEKFGLYIKEDSNECIPLPKEKEGYYISNNQTGLLSKCHNNCLSCYGEGNNENTNCIECAQGYYKTEDSNAHCIMKDLISLDDYYLNNSDNIYYHCHPNCKGCYGSYNSLTEDMYCLNCSDEYYFIYGENNCYKYALILGSNYYFNDNDNKFHKCYYTCSKCLNLEPNEIDHNCIECANNYYKLENVSFPYNCYANDTINILQNSNNNIINSFNSDITINDFKNIIRNDITSYVNSSKVINGSNFLAVVLSSDNMNPEEQLKNGISSVDLGNCTNVIKEFYNISKEENLLILNMETKNEESQKNETNRNNEDKSFNLGKNTQLEIYDNSGRKLNLSVCKEDIKVMKYIGDIGNQLDMDSAKSLSNQGIDVFNANDAFFNDICHQYENSDGKDIILTDRRNDIYQDATFCQAGCTYQGINYDLKAANCKCDSSLFEVEGDNITNNEKTKDTKFKSLTESFISNLIDFNFDILRCYNLALNTKILKHNIGFYCLSFMFILQLIFFIAFIIKRLKPLRNFMLIFKNNNNVNNYQKRKIIKNNNKATPPPKNKYYINISKEENNENKDNKDNKKKKYISDEFNKKQQKYILNKTKDILNIPKFPKVETDSNKTIIVSNNFVPTINIKTPIINIKNNSKKGNNLAQNIKEQINNIKSFKKEKGKKYIKSISKMETMQEKNNNHNTKAKVYNINIISLSKTDSEIQDLDYEEAIIYDKRSYLRMYWGFLVDSQIILGTFCTDNNLDLFVIKLSFLVCTFQISFFLNALFYTDEYISDAYHNDGVLDFFSGLPKSIYSFFATLITTNLLRMLSSSKNELMRVIKRNGRFQNYTDIINIKLAKLRKKLIVYFICVFLLESFFLYYVTVFCAVYRYSQKYWFIGCLESFAMDSFVALIICIFLALFRYISIISHIKCFYIFANIISTFL